MASVLAFGLVSLRPAPVLSQTLALGGYEGPPLISIAPGQVLPLFVTGLQIDVSPGQQRATTVPLPTEMNGISLTLRQSPSGASWQLPILFLEQTNRCRSGEDSDRNCLLTTIVVQIPFDVAIQSPYGPHLPRMESTDLAIVENGVASRSFAVYPAADRIHILKSCDLGGPTRGTGVCFPLVTHADGRFVLQAVRAGAESPPLTNSEAKPGETLIVYAVGLGEVFPAVTAGTRTLTPAPVTTKMIRAQWDYHPNVAPSAPLNESSNGIVVAPALFSGLAPGQVGIYQVNILVPPVPTGTPSCGSEIRSNLTVSITGPGFSTFDGAAICVDPTVPTQPDRWTPSHP